MLILKFLLILFRAMSFFLLLLSFATLFGNFSFKFQQHHNFWQILCVHLILTFLSVHVHHSALCETYCRHYRTCFCFVFAHLGFIIGSYINLQNPLFVYSLDLILWGFIQISKLLEHFPTYCFPFSNIVEVQFLYISFRISMPSYMH